MVYCYKSFIVKYSVLLLLFLFILIPNPVTDRMKNISEINLNEPLSIPYQSLRERVFYLNFGLTLIKDYPITGVGPHRVEPLMNEYLLNNKIMNITKRDHLHNDFLDVWAKFGILIFLFLLTIYYMIYTSKGQEYDGPVHLATMVLILLLSSQLTQSQFAHHQAITIFISLLFTMIHGKNKIKSDE